ncbi:MAG: hypothetical protein V1702_04705 [Candidatus Woesearchaeota archaeon]
MKIITKLGIALFIIAGLIAFFAAYKPAITGYASAGTTLYVLGGLYDYNCNTTMQNGWNLISIPCESENTTVPYVLQTINGKYESVHGYDRNDLNDPWKSYKPGLPAWVEQDLTNITTLKGYWININRTSSINISGYVRVPGVIQLAPGWELVGYPTNVTKTPESAFAAINSSISSVHAYNATDYSDYWKVYVNTVNSSFNDLNLIVPYWGYWINVTSSAVWVITQ